jgi:RNA polymerase sigma-70 factor (ECF subfamily)
MVAAAEAPRLHAALGGLPENQREVLDLLYVRGLSSSEAAKQLEIPVGTVKSRVRLAMRQLRATLAQAEAR